MSLLPLSELHTAENLALLEFTNPFSVRWQELARAVLGEEYQDTTRHWADVVGSDQTSQSVQRLREISGALVEKCLRRLERGGTFSARELELYEDLVVFHLYHRFREELRAEIVEDAARSSQRKVRCFATFAAEATRLLHPGGMELPSRHAPTHLFAFYFQIRRAFLHIFEFIVGGSASVSRLRASVWESIFTHDLRRYSKLLYRRMNAISTLIMGPSGTGKELVARAIGLSSYVPFDEKSQRFTVEFSDLFHPLNLSALSPGLLESELFGHRRGAFTGALEDRKGWFEICQPEGTVFLDEIGDIDLSLQVKLLRVLQTGSFQRLGDTRALRFQGKAISATNRDLAREMSLGRFREDLYYRICSDCVLTPSLFEQLTDAPEDLEQLVSFIARKITGSPALDLAKEVTEWVGQNLGPAYAWPGNFRELEQCVRNILVRKRYQPAPRRQHNAIDEIVESFVAGRASAEEILRTYVTLVYSRTGSLEGAARQLDMDRRTVKAKVDAALLERLKSSGER